MGGAASSLLLLGGVTFPPSSCWCCVHHPSLGWCCFHHLVVLPFPSLSVLCCCSCSFLVVLLTPTLLVGGAFFFSPPPRLGWCCLPPPLCVGAAIPRVFAKSCRVVTLLLWGGAAFSLSPFGRCCTPHLSLGWCCFPFLGVAAFSSTLGLCCFLLLFLGCAASSSLFLSGAPFLRGASPFPSSLLLTPWQWQKHSVPSAKGEEVLTLHSKCYVPCLRLHSDSPEHIFQTICRTNNSNWSCACNVNLNMFFVV